MRIGIDARFFGPQETGIGRYVERLVSHLSAIDPEDEFVLFLRRRGFDWWQPPNAKWRKVLADVPWYGLAEQRDLPGIFHREQLDLLHVPHFNVPFFYRRPFVVTIHDLILDEFPTERATTLGPLLFAVKFRIYQQVVKHAVTKSRKVITVSDYSRQRILNRFHVPESRVAVTYESVDPLPSSVPLQTLSEHGVQQPYLLHVGNSYPHKNLERLVEAMEQLTKHAVPVQLVLVGKDDYFSRRLRQLVQERKLTNIIFYGFASDQELAALYQHAQAYIFPSLSEGFGLPGLEAMQASTPVIAARASCLPEVFGDAALYFDPHSATEMAQSIERVVHDTLLRQRLVAAGQHQLKKYSWRTMAEQTLDLYRQAVTS